MTRKQLAVAAASLGLVAVLGSPAAVALAEHDGGTECETPSTDGGVRWTGDPLDPVELRYHVDSGPMCIALVVDPID